MEITREIAIRVRDIVDAGLVRGKGVQVPGQMCVEAAVCAALGLPHSDDPPCVDPVLRTLQISLNDWEGWASTKSRAAGMRRLALAQLGSAGAIDSADFIHLVIEMTVRRFLPIALRAAASVNPVAEHKQALEVASLQCEKASSLKECEAAGEAGEAAGKTAGWAAGEAAGKAAQEKVYADFCEGVVQVLIEMKAPGCQWLDLVEVQP